MKKHAEALKELGACEDAVAWANGYDTPQAAWDACGRGHWMIWLVFRLSGDPESDSRRDAVRLLVKCLRPAIAKRSPEARSEAATTLDLLERWCAGDPGVTLEDMRAAAWGGCATTAYVAAAAYACAAACVAAACVAAACAVACVAADAMAESRAALAAFVRKHHPEAPKLAEKETPYEEAR